jgi:sugar lactone lactonase YvrE
LTRPSTSSSLRTPKLETLGEHFGLTEGPVWVRDGKKGYLLFSDNAANVINKWSADSPLSVFLEKSGYTGTDVKNVGDQTISGRLAILLTGSNGLTLDGEGRLLITAMTDRNVVRLEKDGRRTLLADRYEGKRFNGPNDIAFKSDGAIYFTDTVFGMRGGADSPSREIPFSGFYLIKDGKVTLLGSDKDHPGEIPNTSKEGKHLGSIQLPQIIHVEPRPRIVPTNLAFGDTDGKTLYITACAHLYRIRLKVPGRLPGPA